MTGMAIRLLEKLDKIARHTPSSNVEAIADIHSLLVLRYERALGSAVNATPLFEAIHSTMNRSQIVVLGNSMALEVLGHNPYVTELLITDDINTSFFGTAVEAIRAQWRKPAFDALLTTSDSRPRIEMLALILGNRLRIGHGSPNIFHFSFTRDCEKSVLEDHLHLPKLLNPHLSNPTPRVYFSDGEIIASGKMLETIGYLNDRPLIAMVTQAGGGQPTDWYEDRFVELADRLIETTNAHIVFLGSSAQMEPIDRIRRAMTHSSSSLAGQTSISEVSALLAQADLLVTLDTGTMHIGRGAEIPMTVIAPAWQPEHEWLPLGVDYIDIVRRNDIGCRNCRKFVCATHECMEEISVDMVYQSAIAMLKRYQSEIALHNNLKKHPAYSAKSVKVTRLDRQVIIGRATPHIAASK